MTFSTAISSFSATFASISTPADTMLYAYNGATLLGTISATTTGQQVLSFNAPSITRVAIAAGSYFDYVAIDNINFTQVTGAVPEPASWALMIGGFGIAGGALRRRATKLAFA
ncbi:MAG: PEP-CTERM sorting domain-containing protein [Sphingomonadales bacterium]|nr:MAG: PEP-CTERM sorting domain-containing protein [Sphingomonadales bacterium]